MLSKIIWAIFGNDEDGPIGDSRWSPACPRGIVLLSLWLSSVKRGTINVYYN